MAADCLPEITPYDVPCFAHITPSHKQPMRHKPDSWLSSGILQCATFENYGPLSFGGGPLFCPGKIDHAESLKGHGAFMSP